ncbi:pilus assembly PilX family protein [Psychrobacter celer]|uniref:pilus assembly PilX family protein n=1 Tax=Psychrobacter celer TaxID=306572 RepID=UPI003FD0F216
MNKKSQEGVTLIVVLLFLMLITFVGIIAVKRSTTDLKVATADQIDTLLLNSSDSGNKRIERVFDNDTDQDYKDAVIKGSGMFGYYLSEAGRANREDQYIFCYNPRQDNFAKSSQASIAKPNGSTVMTTGNGYCDISKSASYASARSNVVTQINVTRPERAVVGQGNFKSVTQGSGIQANEPTNESAVFNIRSTSILPGLSNASKDEINDCLKKPIAPNGSGTTSSLDKCLRDEGISAKTLVQQAYVKNVVDNTVCFGFGEGDGKIAEDCQKLVGVDVDGSPKVN